MPSLKIIAVVPAFNEAKTIAVVIADLKSAVDAIIVVDDGSSDRTGEIARNAGAIVLRHAINRGLGASLQTGFKKALELSGEYIITFDADGQMRASDIARLILPLEKGEADATIGSRVFSRRSAPFLRKIYNFLASVISFIFFGIYVKDTQSGLRAIKREILAKFRPLGDRMEVSSEIVGELGRLGARIKEIPIEPIYTSYSLSKGQGFRTGIKTLISLILHKFK